ncbi:GGDEF domain-containing protein [Pseudonocardiaceae bacterium YIM PH 21723]|nr:GGDEF domain-containing protein [Pseudonocardiaceae bacterium YIM PH 21723]
MDITPPRLAELSDAWLLGRTRELVAIAQRSEHEAQLSAARETDALLEEARRRGEPKVVGQMLRSCANIRIFIPALVEAADPLLDELLMHSRRHGLLVLEAGAHALRGRRALQSGSEDGALTEAAIALAMLDENLLPDTWLGQQRTWERILATVLVDIGTVLTQLGVYELADEVMARAHHWVRESGGPHEISVHLINRCRLLIGWGLRLERVGKVVEAADRFATASAIAIAVEGPWRDSLFPRRDDRPACAQVPILGAARALAHPGELHIDSLYELLGDSMYARELIVVSIGLARCLENASRPREAAQVLASTRKHLDDDTSEPTLRISLVREFARLSGTDGGQETSAALAHYATELESELWALREARIATLLTRLEHERLTREHGAITAQAFQDPLTGLPNRRALDDAIQGVIAQAAGTPMAVALVDMDGFKGVNDRHSHAEGDNVLRIVACTLRDALRTDDTVCRYGGDEFVVLLPGATLNAAEAALQRAVYAVAALPTSLSRNVTLSVGVVPVRAHEPSAEVLSRADEAMYLAKRQGGSRVVAVRGSLSTMPEQAGHNNNRGGHAPTLLPRTAS